MLPPTCITIDKTFTKTLYICSYDSCTTFQVFWRHTLSQIYVVIHWKYWYPPMHLEFMREEVNDSFTKWPNPVVKFKSPIQWLVCRHIQLIGAEDYQGTRDQILICLLHKDTVWLLKTWNILIWTIAMGLLHFFFFWS